jgi:hypothetical protein
MSIINSPLSWVRVIALLGAVTACIGTYIYVGSLQDDITALRASEERYKLSAEQNATTATHNATQYKKLESDTKQLLLQLQQLELQKKAVLDKQKEDEKQDDEFIDSLDKESFESRCYNMPVKLGERLH